MVKGQKAPTFNFEIVKANDAAHPKFELFAGLVQNEFGNAAASEVFRPETNAVLFACERARRSRSDKVAVLGVGYFAGSRAFVPLMADRSLRDTAHVEFFLNNLEHYALSMESLGNEILTIQPGTISPEEFFRRGYEENHAVPGQRAYQLTQTTYLAHLALRASTEV